MEGRGQQNRDQLIPFVDRELIDRRHMLQTGIVDEDVRPAQRLMALLHHGGNFVRAGHIRARP
jgi:hypothetical protein